MKIEIKWTKVDDIYLWINHINNSFKLSDIDIFESTVIEISSKSSFIPIHMLILLGYHINTLETKRKKCIFKWTNEVWNFLKTCWFESFINSSRIDKWNLRDSVILPFSKLPTPSGCQKYLDNFVNRVNYEIKYEIIDQIWEIHNNSIIHWKTQDIFIMWQFYPKSNSIHIIIYDWWNWMLNYDINDYINKIWDKFSTIKFKEEIKNKFWIEAFFIILCVCTNFSTRWINWWMWLQELSRFLYRNNWVIHISSWKTYLNIGFKEICSIIDINNVIVNHKRLDNNIKWTYISFTFSIK
jgi:hypothetical protein